MYKFMDIFIFIAGETSSCWNYYYIWYTLSDGGVQVHGNGHFRTRSHMSNTHRRALDEQYIYIYIYIFFFLKVSIF